MTVPEHIAACRTRALAALDRGGPAEALATFAAAVSEHPATRPLTKMVLRVSLMLSLDEDCASEVRSFLDRAV